MLGPFLDMASFLISLFALGPAGLSLGQIRVTDEARSSDEDIVLIVVGPFHREAGTQPAYKLRLGIRGHDSQPNRLVYRLSTHMMVSDEEASSLIDSGHQGTAFLVIWRTVGWPMTQV